MRTLTGTVPGHKGPTCRGVGAAGRAGAVRTAMSVSHAARAAAHPVVQVLPFSVNAVGLVLVPVWEPLKPISTLPPAAIVPFHAALVTVTADPVWVKAPDQKLVTVWPAGNAKPNDQPVITEVLPLVIFTEAVKPVFQSEVAYLTVHTPGCTVGVGLGVVGLGLGVVGVGSGVVGVGSGVVGVGLGVVGDVVGSMPVRLPTITPRPLVPT